MIPGAGPMGETIEHEGIVKSVRDGKAVVSVRTGGCGGCGHQSGCGLGRLAGKGRETEVTVAVGEGIRSGARVVLSLQPERMVTAALLAYLLPAFAIVSGAAAGAGLGGTDGATALGAAGGLLLGLLLTRLVPGANPDPRIRLLADSDPEQPLFRLNAIRDKLPG